MWSDYSMDQERLQLQLQLRDMVGRRAGLLQSHHRCHRFGRGICSPPPVGRARHLPRQVKPETRGSPPRSATAPLCLAAVTFVLSVWLFGAIAEDVVTAHGLVASDTAISQGLHQHASAALTTGLLAWTHLHSTLAVSAYGGVVSLGLAQRRRWLEAALVAGVIDGGLLLNALLKLVFRRGRPVFDDPLLVLKTYSFPSGHVVGATLLYGLVVAWVFDRTLRSGPRTAVLLLAAAAIVAVAFSRVYLGVHYLSDVVAGFAEGIAWLTMCLAAT